ncbi:MAG TPA: limonene-1,2-epoxide hydrolase family protein [Mycobacteriales bacterium]|nr:limonene-1,2-epoxide hydrolase family protein [Mycobacteriales bacterium]
MSDPQGVVLDFLGALARSDLDGALPLVADDLTFDNVSLPTLRGKPAFERAMRRLLDRGVRVEIDVRRVASDGDNVLTERADTISWRALRVQVWACGMFEVRDGRIALWREYFDWANVIAAGVRGLAGVGRRAIRSRAPAARPT